MHFQCNAGQLLIIFLEEQYTLLQSVPTDKKVSQVECLLTLTTYLFTRMALARAHSFSLRRKETYVARRLRANFVVGKMVGRARFSLPAPTASLVNILRGQLAKKVAITLDGQTILLLR